MTQTCTEKMTEMKEVLVCMPAPFLPAFAGGLMLMVLALLPSQSLLPTSSVRLGHTLLLSDPLWALCLEPMLDSYLL